MIDHLTFCCSSCRATFRADRKLLGQTMLCPNCAALCPLPREAVEIPAHDPRTTDRLLERMTEQQREANRHLWYLSTFLVQLPLGLALGALVIWLLTLLWLAITLAIGR